MAGAPDVANDRTTMSDQPNLLKVIFEAQTRERADSGLAVALLSNDNVLVQICVEGEPYSVTLPRQSALNLVMALCQHLRASEADLARFRSLIDAQWAEVPSA